jgi:hypothetical protein
MKFAPVFRSLDILMIAALIASVVWTFKIKHDSQEALDNVARLQKQIESEENRVDLLKSDWSLLTSPARLEKLVKHYGGQLGLEPIEPAQLADDNTLPGIKQPEITVGDEGRERNAGVDDLISTGSVRQAQPRGAQ